MGPREFRPQGHALIAPRNRPDPGGGGRGPVHWLSCSPIAPGSMPENPAPEQRVFGISPRYMGRKIRAAAEGAGQGAGLTGHSVGVGMAKVLVWREAELRAGR